MDKVQTHGSIKKEVTLAVFGCHCCLLEILFHCPSQNHCLMKVTKNTMGSQITNKFGSTLTVHVYQALGFASMST